MAEQDIQISSDGELPPDNAMSTLSVAAEEEGVDGEIDEMDDSETNTAYDTKSRSNRELLSSRDVDLNNKDSVRYHSSSEHRRHRHHISSHRDRRRRSSGRSDTIDHLSDPDSRSSNGRLKQRPVNQDDSLFDPSASDTNYRLYHRKHNKSRGNPSHGNQQRSGHNLDSHDSRGLSELHGDSLALTADRNSVSKQVMKEKRDFHRTAVKGLAEKGEAEDGEILEDGELSDDEDAGNKHADDASRETIEVPTSKSSSKDKHKGENLDRKRSDHKGKRKHENDAKRKKKKFAGMDNLEDENNPTPAWGSGYQGPKKKVPAFSNKEQRFSTGTKGYESPPGLYDSPSYSENSDEESIPKALLTEGYIDASVAADEKEGIFNHKVSLTKKSKRHFVRNDHKRGRNLEHKFEGPPRKKPLHDMSMSERPACKFYLEGKCAKGSLCQFNHDVEKPKKMEVCKYHLTVKGCIREKCQYMHHFPCKYYHTGAKCYSGDKCKFSHEPLTEGSRRALEMRVAAEDIIDMEDPEYNYEYRPRETHGRPSLLGSPPRFRPEVKKIPSLFEIEVHPPGQSSKSSPQTTRPSGFYSETNVSPKPGIGLNNAGVPISSHSMGIMSNTITSNQSSQHGLSNQTNIGGSGLLQVPMRPNIMMNGPASNNNNRPTMLGNQQGITSQQQRVGGGPSIQFLGPGQMNNNNQQPQSGNLPPVLNMLGAIIREAAIQQGSVVLNNNMNMGPSISMGLGSIQQNMNNIVPNMNNMGPNNMRQENLNLGPNNSIVHNSITPNIAGSMPPSNANNTGPMNIGLNMMGSMGLVSSIENTISNNSKASTGSAVILGCLNGSNKNIAMSQQNIGQEDDNMDVDYRIKRNFEEMKDESQDLHELDKIRQQIQAQIDREDEQECTAPESNNEDIQLPIKDEQFTLETSDSIQDNEELKDNKAAGETEVEHIEIPDHLPKKQKELFKRIQQQQLLREKEWEKQEALKAAEEAEVKDDWYSSDEDGKSEKKPKLTDVLKKLNTESSAAASGSSSFNLGSFNASSPGQTTTPSSASAFNIMQMINTIKSQSAASSNTSTSKLGIENVGIFLPEASNKLSLSQGFHHMQETLSSPASPQPVSSAFIKLSETLCASTPTLHLPALTVDPPVVSALPLKPLVYAVVKISLSMFKPYTQLPDTVRAPDPAFKDDPRVKWHLNYLEKQVPKEPERRESSEAERPQKLSDPRLKKEVLDSRFAKTGGSPTSGRGDGSTTSDLSFMRVPQVQSVPADPRLARLASGNLDPRLNRQNSQHNQETSSLMNNMGSGPMIGLGAQMGSPFNLINGPMRGNMEPMNYMGNPINNIGGLVNNQMSGGINSMGMDGPGMLMQCRSGPINNTGPMVNNINMRGPVSQNVPVPDLLNRFKGLQETGNVLADLENSNMMSGPGNSMMRVPLGQHYPLRTDSTPLDPRVNNSLDPRLRSQKTLNDTPGSSDPRLKKRALGAREQLTAKEPGLVGIDPRPVISNPSKDNSFIDQRTFDNNSEFRPFPSKPSLNYLQGDAATCGAPGQFKMFQSRENWASDTVHRVESEEHLTSASVPSSVPSPAQYSNTDEKITPNFDYRNDPRFRRVKRLMGQQKNSLEYSSSLGGEEGQEDSDVGGTNEQSCPSHNSYNSTRSSGRDPRSRNVRSPELPDKLQDFDLSNSPSSTVAEPESNIKVKDLFKTIDPTASPFC